LFNSKAVAGTEGKSGGSGGGNYAPRAEFKLLKII
jgi:hypothetical protein